MTEPLYPAALAVMTAGTMGNPNVINDPVYRQCIAAALRAAADQVVPVASKPNDTFCCPPVDTIVWMRLARVREELLAIAAELEGAGA
jgi:hypothetical protein